MEKEMEMKLLRELGQKGSYFGEFFGNDVDQMCENIRNDFPIEFGTTIKEALQQAEKERETIKNTIIGKYFECHEADVNPQFVETLYLLFGRLDTIRGKVNRGITLTRSDFEWLFQRITLKGV